MIRMFKICMLLCLLPAAAATASSDHGTGSVRINEVLVQNVDNYIDDYGHRSSWIELYNTSHSTVDVGGCYFKAVVNGQEYTYRIPTGDPQTKMGPLGYCVFFCEGTDTKGPMYTNFTMEGIEYLALTASPREKQEPIDEVRIDYAAQLPDISIGYLTLEDGRQMFMQLPRTTPNATNDMEPLVPRSEKFRERDPHGAMMAMIAIVVVLSVLTILFLFFKFLGNYMVSLTRKKVVENKAETAEEMAKGKSYHSPYSGEEVAAISIALKMYADQLHDKESAVLTINKVARTYSPWSSKIYGLTQFVKK